jgi:uncharacterized integral membrane protein
MIVFFILGLMVGGVMVIFALQNIELVTVTFFAWQFEGSLALVLLLTTLVGIILTTLLLLPSTVIGYFKLNKLKRVNASLEEELRKQKERTVFAKTTDPTAEEIAHIETGAIANPDSR